MKHKKEAPKKEHHSEKAAHGKMGRVEPMAHPKGAQHLKPMKKGHKDVSGH